MQIMCRCLVRLQDIDTRCLANLTNYEQHHLCAGRKMERMVVKPETALVRPFFVCAILRGITLDEHRYKSFIDLQVIAHYTLPGQL